jgi:hypothetical protein
MIFGKDNVEGRNLHLEIRSAAGRPDLQLEKATELVPLGQKIEAVEGIVPVRLSLVARCAAIGLMQLRIADLPIFVLGCCELHSQKQAQLKVGAFEPQPSVYQN